MTWDIDRSVRAARDRAASLAPLGTAPFVWIMGLLIAVGILARLSPLFDVPGRLFWQYMTEDGYLMETIARNMAIGLGMSTAEGTIQTNGVQPLATFLFAGFFWLASGSKPVGIALITVFSAVVAAAAGYVLYRVAAQVLRGIACGRPLAIGIAALWFASPLLMPISMNGLETGLYHLVVLCALAYYLAATGDDAVSFGWRQRAALGGLLGLTFLARNDAVFFIAALLLVHLLVGGARALGGYASRFVDCLVAGLISIVIASPWLIYNYNLFGSIVPISGTAQSHAAALGTNLPRIPAKLFETMVPYLPIPNSWEPRIGVALACGLVILGVLFIYWRLIGTSSVSARRFSLIGAGFGVGLVTYYGVFFGAEWFLTRYLSVLSLFLWVAATTVAFHIALLVFRTPTVSRGLLVGLTASMCLLAAAFAGNSWRSGTTHMHKQVVDWVVANVGSDIWVGAPQTGTLGFFHDRTINLDGKVNPAALEVLMHDGHILNYVADSEIDYIADWIGMADWDSLGLSPSFERDFEVVVRDPSLNLAVLKRIRSRSGK